MIFVHCNIYDQVSGIEERVQLRTRCTHSIKSCLCRKCFYTELYNQILCLGRVIVENHKILIFASQLISWCPSDVTCNLGTPSFILLQLDTIINISVQDCEVWKFRCKTLYVVVRWQTCCQVPKRATTVDYIASQGQMFGQYAKISKTININSTSVFLKLWNT